MFSRSFIPGCGAALFVFVFVSLVPAAGAAPITIPQSGAVAAARSDAGTGLCGAAVFYKTQMSPLSRLDETITLLNKPPNDANIMDRRSRTFDNINFRNTDAAAARDFTTPGFADALFPYSNSASADPPGLGTNIALRLRGYLNIRSNLGGNPMTFGVNCDDACSLKVGGQVVIPFADERISSRVTQQVIFQAPGLYPVEIVYYQNGSAAFLEWSRALTAEPEGNQPSPLNVAKFQIVPAADLFSTIVGANPACQECGAPGQVCATGYYCGDGLCQTCNVPDHCGSTCQTCPAGSRICGGGRCVECLTASDCAAGKVCTPDGRCVQCVVNDDCGAGLLCTAQNQCVQCQSQADCALGQTCSPQNQCVPCTSDSACPTGSACNPALGACETGTVATGCTCTYPQRQSRVPASAVTVIAALLAAVALRRRRNRPPQGLVD